MDKRIFGITTAGLCYKGERCQKKEKCKYTHPQWITKICVHNLKNQCERANCSRNHVEWANIDKIATQENSKDMFKKLTKATLNFSVNIEMDVHPGSIQINEPTIQIQSQKVVKEVQIQEKDKKDSFIQQMKAIVHEMKQTEKLDVLLMLDCTGSMSKWIEEAKNNLKTIIQKFQQKTVNFVFRVGFIGYRDFDDGDKQFVIQNFTANIDSVQQLISTQVASGGGDEAEDLCGALSEALKFDYKEKHSLHCFLVCDSPCHGEQYHSKEVSDLRAKDVQTGSLERLMNRLQNKQGLARFTAISITEKTDIMYKIMQENFEGMEITAHSNPTEFSKILTDALQTTINTMTRLQIESQPQKEKDNLGYTEVTQITYKFPKLVKTLNENYWKETFPNQLKEISKPKFIKIEEEKIGQGKESDVYTVSMLQDKIKYVIKVPKNCNWDEEYQKQDAKQRMISSAYAFQLTKYFRQMTHHIESAPLLFFLPPMMFTLKTQFKGMTHVYAEPRLNDFESFTKFSNNWDFCKEQTFASFSHFTYQATNGYLLITDLQGAGFVLTDPAIQSLDSDRFKEKTNLQLQGFGSFFTKQHPKCNSNICSKIGLQRPEWETPEPLDVDEVLRIPMIMEQINAICELCYAQEKVNFLDQKKNLQSVHYLFTCQTCTKECKKLKKYHCVYCKTYFIESAYIYEKMGKKQPRKCQACKAKPKY